jgi:hypothetical protein
VAWNKRIKRARGGGVELRIPEPERELLRSLPEQLRLLLADEGPELARLFPTAYLDDLERDAEYRRYMREELVQRRLASLTVMEETIDATHLTEDQAMAWMKVLNDVRLVLGTILNVSEEPIEVEADDPRAPQFAVYHYLSGLVDEAVSALAR